MNAPAGKKRTLRQVADDATAGGRPAGFEFEAAHTYRDTSGHPLFYRVRYRNRSTGAKWIRPMRKKEDGTVELKEPTFEPGCRPLYGLDKLAGSPGSPVVVVEGEGCADALLKLGVLATTSGGADSAARADWQPLAGRDVTIWPDHDDAGQRYAAAAAERLQQLGCRVRILDVAALDLPAKGDAVDWLKVNPNAVADDVRALPANEAGQTDQLPYITQDELANARLTPRVILRDLLYCDVRTRISAGGTGKTTLAIFEAVTLALGRPLYGRQPDRPCRTVIVTREDTREILVARMREITAAMNLDKDDIQLVLERCLIIDMSAESFRLSEVLSDVVTPHHGNIERLIEMLADWHPDWLIFDPLVSFGVGESRVNDAEQGLIEAFRILRNRLDCCIEGIHHSGKANAREKILDQYAGRGGSALADGSRMVAVMRPLDHGEWMKETGTRLADDESGIVMALPKLSYGPSQQPIYIRRRGYSFKAEIVCRRSQEQAARDTADQVFRFLASEFEQGRKYSLRDIENSTDAMNLTRAEIRSAITELKVAGRVLYHHVSGRAGSHFEPASVAESAGDGALKIDRKEALDGQPHPA